MIFLPRVELIFGVAIFAKSCYGLKQNSGRKEIFVETILCLCAQHAKIPPTPATLFRGTFPISSTIFSSHEKFCTPKKGGKKSTRKLHPQEKGCFSN